MKNVKNPWKDYAKQSRGEDRNVAMRDSVVPMHRKNLERIYQKHKAEFDKMGIKDLESAMRYAENAPDYGVGLGAAEDPDRMKKQKIMYELNKAARGYRKLKALRK